MRAGNDSLYAIWLGAAANAGGRRKFGFNAGGSGANAPGGRRSGRACGGRDRGGSQRQRRRHHEGHRRQQARLEPAQCRCVDVDRCGADVAAAWSANERANGTSAVSVKQSISPFWDTRIGADMTVSRQGTATTSELLSEKLANGGSLPQSSGTAWAAITAPGVASIWDKTSVEARVDPGSEQSRIGTSLSKSLPLSEQYSLTLKNDYNLIQQGIVPVPGIVSHPARSHETDQSARLSIADTGTSLIAGQTLSASDDKWLRKVGAEQKLFDGVTISGSIGETPSGVVNKSFGAGFKRSW